MKKKLGFFALLAIMMASLMITPVPVRAVSSATTTTTDADKTSVTEQSTARLSRISAYKQKLATALTDVAKVRVAARCEAAQALVKKHTTTNTTATTARTNAYKTIVSDLQALSTALAAKSIDVTKFDADMAVLQTKITAFNTAHTTFKQDLSDLSVLDCKSDPTAFQAALQVTRTDQALVLKEATAVRTYINDTIKPELKALKAALKTPPLAN